ncbi:MAG TPA: RNA polymerase sigma factor region1.1 domain-containing protein, partial [Xanthobacteraceae bacterium]|nr:RNA polymerase sigma factor region1.1 domain-containing protein [Xanthobacteraceae bacterium]
MATKSAATKPVTKAKAVRQNGSAPPKDAEAAEKETPETPDAPLPLLDLTDAAVKKMIKSAKKRGYVTYEQLNAVMPSEEVTSEKIEDILAMMNEMGINVVETEEAEADDGEGGAEEAAEEEETESGEVVEVTPKTPAKSETR